MSGNDERLSVAMECVVCGKCYEWFVYVEYSPSVWFLTRASMKKRGLKRPVLFSALHMSSPKPSPETIRRNFRSVKCNTCGEKYLRESPFAKEQLKRLLKNYGAKVHNGVGGPLVVWK